MSWLRRLQDWLFGAVPAPNVEPYSTLEERAAAVKVLEDVAGVRSLDARQVDAIVTAARRYALAIQRHDDELIDAREASAVEGRLLEELRRHLREVVSQQVLVPAVGHEIVRALILLGVGARS